MRRTDRETVRPMTSIAPRTSWPLTAIDRFASQWVIQGTWVFNAPLDAIALKHGLARLLDVYPILCGRMSRDRIERGDEGVPFVVESDMTHAVQDFAPSRVDVTRFGYRCRPALIRRGRAPLLTVTLTQLRDGCVLGICASHTCLDGNGFYSMVRNLSRATTGRDFPQPVFARAPDRSRLRRRTAVARSARDAGWHRLTLLDVLRYAIARPRLLDRSLVARFSPEMLRRCKTALARDSSCERLSTNSALLAHVTRCAGTLLGLDARSRIVVSAAVDQRGRVAGLPESFAGNAVSLAATAPIAARASAADIARSIHTRLEPLLERPSTELESITALTGEVAAHRLPYTPLPGARLLEPGPTLFYTNSFWKFPVYDVDFGDGTHPVRPVRAIPHNLGDPIVLWPAPPSTGGIELYFSGSLARAVARLDSSDDWWNSLYRFDQ